TAPERQRGHRYLLVQRSSDESFDGRRRFICFSDTPTSIEQLVRVATSHWTIEECIHTGRNDAGLDQHQVRDYTAWYRHITLSMVALAFLTLIETARERDPVVNPPFP